LSQAHGIALDLSPWLQVRVASGTSLLQLYNLKFLNTLNIVVSEGRMKIYIKMDLRKVGFEDVD
jgi:hypothetical protein